jgi:mycoredoxin
MTTTTSQLIAALALTLTACGGSASDAPKTTPGDATEAASGPAELTLERLAPGTVLRYRDPAGGAVASATELEGVPTAARRAVVVFDPTTPTPPGADFVADLSGPPPWKARAVKGFSFPPPDVQPTVDAPAGGSPEVVLFATEWCGYCGKARKTLTALKVPYTELDLEKDATARPRMEALARKAGVDPGQLQGVPILFIGGKPIVGWDEQTVLRLLGRG